MPPILIPLSPTLYSLLEDLAAAGRPAFVVGGAVRDALLGKVPKDIDIEVSNCSYDDLAGVLSRRGRIDIVGRSFGVIKFTDSEGNSCDFSVPRRDNRTGGVGHKGFHATFDPTMTPPEAAARRDFTWNAMSYDPLQQEIHDYFGGQKDLEEGILRHTSAAFAEDPLRVLRGMQFAARFGHRLAPETAALCRRLADEILDHWTRIPGEQLALWYRDPDYTEGPKGPVPGEEGSYRRLLPHETLLWVLPKERLAEEWMKLAARGKQPSRLFDYLLDTGWMVFFPEIGDLVGVPQEPEWHPEGPVHLHTGHTMDAAVMIADRDGLEGDDRAVLVLAALVHDFGKAHLTLLSEKLDPRTGQKVLRWTSSGHEEAGGALAEAFLSRMGIKPEIIRKVVPLVENHLRHLDFDPGRNPQPRVVRRLADRLRDSSRKHHASIQELARLIEADHSGRPAPGQPLSLSQPEALKQMLRMAAEYQVDRQPIQPLILGRHIQPYGLPTGPVYSQVTRDAREAQIEGHLTADNAQQWLDQYMKKNFGLERE